MNGKSPGLLVLHQAEKCAHGADEDSEVHERQPADAAQAVEFDLREVGNLDVRLAGEGGDRCADQNRNGR